MPTDLIHECIADLYRRREELTKLITCLESLDREHKHDSRLSRLHKTKSTRGRKSMSVSERREVSARMRRYWAKKRVDKKESASVH